MSRPSLSKFTLSLITLLILAATNPLFAIVIFSENFEAGTACENLGSPWTLTSGGTSGATGEPSSVKVQADTTGNLFGAIDNKYGEFLDPRTGSPAARADNFSFGSVSNSFLTVSFDFYEVSGYTI